MIHVFLNVDNTARPVWQPEDHILEEFKSTEQQHMNSDNTTRNILYMPSSKSCQLILVCLKQKMYTITDKNSEKWTDIFWNLTFLKKKNVNQDKINPHVANNYHLHNPTRTFFHSGMTIQIIFNSVVTITSPSQ